MRTRGEGTIQELPGGKFRGRLRVPGTKKQFFGPTVNKRTEALPAMWQKWHRLQEEEAAQSEESNFSTFVQERIEQMRSRLSKGEGSPTTIDTWTAFLRRIESDPIGRQRPSEITDEDVQGWKDRQQGGPRTVRNNVVILKQALKESGATVTVTVPPQKEVLKRTLSQEEQQRLLSIEMPEDTRTMVLLALRMGLRRSEISGLRHSDRDGDGVNVKRALVRATGILALKGTKTTSSEAWVPLCRELEHVVGHGQGYVLQRPDGRPLSGSVLHDRWRKVVDGTEFEDIGLHELRATYGMTLLESGVDLRTAAEMMRHDPAVLARLYARSRRDLKREARKKAFG